jgi:hypothetical protein
MERRPDPAGGVTERGGDDLAQDTMIVVKRTASRGGNPASRGGNYDGSDS